MTAATFAAIVGLLVARSEAVADRRSTLFVLTIDLTDLESMPHGQREVMIDETVALWRPQGVEFDWVTSATRDSGRSVALRVLSDHHPGDDVRTLTGMGEGSRSRSGRRLGAVLFRDGQPALDHSIRLSTEGVVQSLASVTWLNRTFADLTERSRQFLLGRALGRVLAHEIGHYLLAQRTHDHEGLMRPVFRAGQLVEPDRRAFRIPDRDRPRLRRRLAQLEG